MLRPHMHIADEAGFLSSIMPCLAPGVAVASLRAAVTRKSINNETRAKGRNPDAHVCPERCICPQSAAGLEKARAARRCRVQAQRLLQTSSIGCSRSAPRLTRTAEGRPGSAAARDGNTTAAARRASGFPEGNRPHARRRLRRRAQSGGAQVGFSRVGI